MINLTGESIWGQPFRHRARINECAVNSLRFGPEYSMKPDCVGIVCGHIFPLYLKLIDPSTLSRTRIGEIDIRAARKVFRLSEMSSPLPRGDVSRC